MGSFVASDKYCPPQGVGLGYLSLSFCRDAKTREHRQNCLVKSACSSPQGEGCHHWRLQKLQCKIHLEAIWQLPPFIIYFATRYITCVEQDSRTIQSSQQLLDLHQNRHNVLSNLCTLAKIPKIILDCPLNQISLLLSSTKKHL